jgi:hypothetical protein
MSTYGTPDAVDLTAKISTISEEDREKKSQPQTCRGLVPMLLVMSK